MADTVLRAHGGVLRLRNLGEVGAVTGFEVTIFLPSAEGRANDAGAGPASALADSAVTFEIKTKSAVLFPISAS
ncbi:hypothetical protein [Paracoccus tibetensis]|uniref:hypothetical protein n=1 Tax=Paracoccus tibetensis TaxID=336292 RepID=UPI001C313E7C|nr:hypothetical protein [Paracoccus tibetensis]